MVEIEGVHLTWASQTKVHSIAGLIENNLSDQLHSIQQHACVHHHFVCAVLMPHDLYQVVLL